MGKGRACVDIFSLNSLIDAVKTEYLYQASVTECPPSGPTFVDNLYGPPGFTNTPILAVEYAIDPIGGA